MSVGLAVSLLTAGVLADDRGRRRVFVIGLVVLGIASAVAAAAGHTGIVIAARLVEGAGGAAVLVGGLGMIGHAVPDRGPHGPAPRRSGAPRSVPARGSAGSSRCLLDGADGSWRVTYIVTAVAALLFAVVARRVLPESVTAQPRPVDLAGVVLLAAGMGALLAGLVESRSGGPWVLGDTDRGRDRAARRLRRGAGPAPRAADRPRAVPVARVRRRDRRCAGGGDRASSAWCPTCRRCCSAASAPRCRR